ncbi:MAG: group 1 truncated hemoglobin [Bacteroidota bacterium]
MENSIYERIGGANAIVAAVELFYLKVLSDDSLSPFFEGLSMESQGKKMISFMAWAFGGPDEFKGRQLKEAHARLVDHMGLTDSHFDSIAFHLNQTLDELNVDPLLKKEVLDIVSSTREEVLGRSH